VVLLMLIQRYHSSTSSSMQDKEEIVKIYLENIKQVNNWDLVDLSAPNILGAYLFEKRNERKRKLLYRLAGSEKIWKRRIAIVSTHYFIRNGNFSDTLKIAELLLHDKHDLIHKASGWMLREVGKRDTVVGEAFLEKLYSVMRRAMLRYAIEKLPENKRSFYMKKVE